MVPLVPPHHCSLFNSVSMSSDFQSLYVVDDQEFVRQLYQVYYDPLYLSAVKLCHNSMLSPDDLVQDLFLKILRQLRQFRQKLEQEENAGYLFVSLKNQFLDNWRSDKSRRQNEQAVGNKRIGHNSLYSQCADIWQEHIEDFIASVLKDRELEIMIHYARGLKYKEIASALRMNINTVGVSIKRSKEKLKKVLEETPGLDRFKNIDIEKWRRKKPRDPELFDEEE